MDQFEAARAGDHQQLRHVLTAHNVDDNSPTYDCTALHYAASYEQVECVKVCMEMGANVNARTNGQQTPLHGVASMRGNVEIARMLLDEGAIVDAKNRYGITPLYSAIFNNHMDVARSLIDRGGKVSNVKLNVFLPAIPDWVTNYVASRSNCRIVSIVIIGIHKYRRTNLTGNNDINVLKLVAKHIWSSRMDDGWSAPRIEAKKLR
jgi:ankyrin repeat protein